MCDVPGSSLVRESNMALMTKAGTEIGVGLDTSLTTQLTVLLMLVAKLARLKGQDASIEHDIVHGLQALPNRIEQMLSRTSVLSSWQSASLISTMRCSLAVAIGLRIAMEGALKLKEISYIHAEAYAAASLSTAHWR